MAFRRNLRSRPNSESQGLGQCHLCCEQDSNEDLITCNICANQFHPIKCLLLSEWTLNKILDKSNSWSCNKCKSCEICRRKKYLRSTRCGSDKTLILCKGCDKGFHRSCIKHPKNTSAAVVEIGDDFYCRSCKKEGNFGKSDQKEDVGEGLEEEAGNNMDEEDEEDEAGEEDANMDDYQDADMEQDEPEDCSSSDETETTHVRQTRSRTAKTRGTQSAIKVKTDDDESDVVSTASDEAFAEADSKTNVKRKCAKRRRRGTKSGKTSSNAKKRILRTGGDEDDEDEILKNENDEERETTCPVPGCDSKGHLSGKYESHVTASTCPLFHNVDSESCVEGYQKRLTRKRFSEQMVKQSSKRSKDHSQLAEQRKKEISTILNQSPPRKKEHSYKTNTAREPMLKSLSPIFDFEMFREAQARAAELLQEQLKESNNKRSGIKSIVMGKYEVEVWYSSPYPEEYLCLPKLYICEFCLKYFNSPLILKRHNMKCPWHCPPGDEIYRKLNISIFEIDGEKNKFYCQNLCLLAKLFLDHKTLYYDVEPFKFYIMTECDSEGYHIIGYFSKEKNSFLNYNVSCILTFPPYQKQGYGRMLIDFSYLLTKTEGKVGSPEKPLSDLGLISYRSYWKNVILEYLCNYEGSEISIKDLSQETAINAYDIVSTLQALGMLKYWKGKHLVLTRKEILDEYRAKMKKRKNTKTIDPTCLHWQPAVPN